MEFNLHLAMVLQADRELQLNTELCQHCIQCTKCVLLHLFKMHLKVTWLSLLLLLLSQMNLEMKVGIIIIIVIVIIIIIIDNNNSFICIEPFIQKIQLKVLHIS